MPSKITIILLSGSASCGKSTVGEMLVSRAGFVPLMFAKPIKVMWEELQKLFPMLHEGTPLVTAADLESESVKMQRISNADPRTNRFVMQRLGDVCKTAFGREDVFSQNVVHQITELVSRAFEDDQEELRILVTDNRFPDEYKTITESLFFLRCSIERWMIVPAKDDATAPSLKDASTATHPSETMMTEMKADRTIVNAKDGLDKLWEQVEKTLAETLAAADMKEVGEEEDKLGVEETKE